jgi:hypothetical protein
MKKALFFLLSFFIITYSFGQLPTFQWARKSISGATHMQQYSIAVDSVENVYYAGHFTGTQDFDPGVAIHNLTSAGLRDIFICKLDVSGNFLWAKQIGGASDDAAQTISLDNTGNICISGFFSGLVDFDPGAGTNTLASAGGVDVFISKFDPSGNMIWAKCLGGTSNDNVSNLVADLSNNIYVTGSYSGTVDFDPGAAIFNLSGSTSYTLKLDASGNFMWATNIGGRIALDNFGYIYRAGSFSGTVDFDPGPGIFNVSSTGGADIFITKSDNSGNFLWVKTMGGTLDDYPSGIAIDSIGNIFTTGNFFGTCDFDAGPGTFNLISAGFGDIFILKLDNLGNFSWAKRIGRNYNEYTYGIALDVSANVYTTGSFSGPTDFDPGAGVYNLATDTLDVYISKLDSSGNFVWAVNIGGQFDDHGSSVTLDISANVYTIGLFSGTPDFNPGAGIYNLTSGTSSGQHIFVHKMSQDPCIPPLATASNQTICSGNSVTLSATGTGTLGWYTTATGGVYLGGGSTYITPALTLNTTYYVQDSICAPSVTRTPVLITVNTLPTVTANASATQVCSGNSLLLIGGGANTYSWTGGVYNDSAFFPSSTNTYTVTGTDINNCSDTATITIVVNSFSLPSTPIIGATGNILTSSSGYSYQWYLDSDTISLATSQTYTAPENGDYSVIITDANGCWTSSVPYTVSGIAPASFHLDWLWAKSPSRNGDDRVNGLTTEASGNILAAGNFSNTIVFGSDTLVSAGSTDMFVVKYDSAGNSLWAKRGGAATYGETAGAVATDTAGNVFVIGHFSGPTITFGSTVLSNTSSFTSDFYLVKYDSSGNLLWAKKAGGTGNDYASSLKTDSAGNVFISGSFSSSSIVFGSTTLTRSGPSGSQDMFLVKYDNAGNAIWAKKSSGTGDEVTISMAINNAGEICITGEFNGTATFGTTTLVGSGIYDVFIAKYDNNGNTVWAQKAGGTGTDRSASLALDKTQNIIIAGGFSSPTINFGSLTLSSVSFGNNFLAKYDSNGNPIWAKKYGGSGEYLKSVAVDQLNHILIAGSFQSPSLTLSGSVLSNSGGEDLFIVKLDSMGNEIWADGIGGNNNEIFNAATFDDLGNIIAAGNFQSPSLSFGADTLINAGNWDLFVGKTTQCINAYKTISTSICMGDIYTLPGGDSISLAGIYQDTISRTNGCDSIITTSILINQLPTPVITPSGATNLCNGNSIILDAGTGYAAYSWPNGSTASTITVTSSQTDSVSVVDVNGCSATSPPITITFNTDCVWPGDANHDSIVDNSDLLPIGLHYAQTGPPRASVSNLWQDYVSTNWGTLQVNGEDIKHADCNGDGLIDNNDTLAVNLNFSSTHAILINNPDIERLTDPEISLIPSVNVYNAGDWVEIEVHTGTSILPVNDLYGLAFNIYYDASLAEPGTESLTYPAGWLGNPGTNAITISKIDPLASTAFGGITRIDHQDQNGYGKIANFRFQAANSITSTEILHFAISGYMANDSAGSTLLFNINADSVIINPFATNITENTNNTSVSIYPNPFTSETTISFTEEQKDCTIRIMDVLGKEIRTNKFSGKRLIIRKEEMLKGIYFVEITAENGSVLNKKIVVQ